MAAARRPEDSGMTDPAAIPDNAPELVTAESAIGRALRDNPCSFEFFQAVSLIQRLRAANCSPVGQFSNPEDEAAHFRVNNTLGFPASQIQDIQWEDDSTPAQMNLNFMGLTGPQGVLPYAYTELILERLKAKDKSLQSFLDIFNHRIISFFYRAWEKYRFPSTYYRGDHDFTHHLLDFLGLGTPGLADRQAVPDEALLHYAALFGAQARSAAALQTILENYFDVPVEIEQFAGAWYRLDPSSQSCMNESFSDPEQLGLGSVIGDEIWNQECRVRVRLGPLSLPRYQDFLPGGDCFEPLKALLKFFSNDELDFELMLIMKREEVPGCKVGAEDGKRPRLGWVSWLKSVPQSQDSADAIPLDHDPGDTILNL
jgi:type VI secretion system protein ImpH